MSVPPAAAPARARRELRISDTMTVGRASLLMAAMIALSRLTGFGRLVLTSHLYGRGPVTDAYNAAFNIPETITIIIAGGALATGFVPVFTEYLAKGETAQAQHTFRAMLTLLGVSFGAISLVLFALTYTPAALLLAPQKVGPANLDLYLQMLRILLAAQFFFVLGGMFAGTLNALRLFLYPALQPVLFNLGIIVFGLALPHTQSLDIKNQAWGALAGALAGTLFIQAPATVRHGLSLWPLWDWRDPGVRRVLRSLLPIVFGLASGQIIGLNLPRFFATTLPPGDLTALDNANRLMQVPLDLLASGPAIALFPTLSLLSAQGKIGELRDALAATFRRTLGLTLLATGLLAALRYPVIHLLLEHGAFTPADTRFTSGVLLFYAFCVIGLGAQQLLARGFYALGDTRTPVIVGAGAMALFCLLSAVFLKLGHAGAPGLALAAAVAVTLLALWMGLALRARLGGWDDGATLSIAGRAAIGAVAAYFAAHTVAHYALQWGVRHGLDTHATPSTVKLTVRTVELLLSGAAGVAAFVLVMLIASEFSRQRSAFSLKRQG